jgi:hypothetical protein
VDNLPLQERMLPLSSFLKLHETRAVKAKGRHAFHPMSVIDFDGSSKQYMKLPTTVKAASLGHIHSSSAMHKSPLDLTTRVSNYIVMSERDSMTNFHTEFSATSVFYHVVQGAQEFFLLQNTPQNLRLFNTWSETHQK